MILPINKYCIEYLWFSAWDMKHDKIIFDLMLTILCPSWVELPKRVNNFAILHAIYMGLAPIDSPCKCRFSDFIYKCDCLVLWGSSKLWNFIHFQWHTFVILHLFLIKGSSQLRQSINIYQYVHFNVVLMLLYSITMRW